MYAGDPVEGREVGVGEGVGDGGDEACWWVACCEDGEADVEVRDDGQEGGVFADAAEFVECCGELVG